MTDFTSSGHHKPKKPTVLVIEDNPDQWFLIQHALQERFSEVEAVWRSEVNQAVVYLETCEQNGYDLPKLILLDLYVPLRQNGWSLLQIIKTHHIYRDIPVVILSQSSNVEDVSESYALRTNSYIVKPSSYDKWLDCISSFRHYWWEFVTLPTYY